MTLLLQGAGIQTTVVTPADPIGDGLRADAQVYYIGNNLVDATGHGNVLTNNAGVTFAAGLVGNAFHFAAASTQYLSAPTSANLETGAIDFEWVCWVKFDSLPAVNESFVLLNKVQYVETPYSYTDEYDIYMAHINDGEHPEATYFDYTSLNDLYGIDMNPFLLDEKAQIDVWYFVEQKFDTSANTLSMRINLNQWVTVFSNQYTGALNAGDLNIGYNAFGESGALNGSMQLIGHWHRHLAEDEAAYLYNSSAGRALFPAP